MAELSHEQSTSPAAPRELRGGLRFGIALAAGVLGTAAAMALGVWQVHRADAKLVLQARVEAAARAAPVSPGAGELAHPDRLVFRHLEVSGRWLQNDAVFLDNRPLHGRAGFYVLMPLALEATPAPGARPATLVVNRGWLPRDPADRARIAPFVTPPGIVRVAGVALADEPRLLELGHGEKKLGGIWQNFDFDAFAAASRTDPVHVVLRQDPDAGSGAGLPADGLVRDWPDRGGTLQDQIDRHHGYAFQWFALAAVIAALTLFQSFRHVRARTRPAPT